MKYGWFTAACCADVGWDVSSLVAYTEYAQDEVLIDYLLSVNAMIDKEVKQLLVIVLLLIWNHDTIKEIENKRQMIMDKI